MKSIILSIIILFSGTECMANLSDQIVGTWIGISHQSITVVTYNSDGTLFGTYQTSSLNIKTTVSVHGAMYRKIRRHNQLES
jgi:hypothetical protein